MSDARLNLFQQAMLTWEKIHPYIAVHSVRLEGPADPELLQKAIDAVFREAGIGKLQVGKRGKSCTYVPLEKCPVQRLPDSGCPDELLMWIAGEGMNSPFPEGPHVPFRWAIFNEAGRGAHHIVLTYHHVVSDAHGVASLLGAVLQRYRPDAAGPWRPAFEHRNHARQNGAVRSLGYLSGFCRAYFLYRRIRKAFRLPETDYSSARTGVLFESGSDGLMGRLSAEAARRGVGVNDLFLAAVASAIASQPAYLSGENGGPSLGLGTVMNARSNGDDVSDWGKVCLRDVVLLIDQPAGELDEVIAQVAHQTRRHKSFPHVAGALSAARILWARHVWPLLRIRPERASYLKYLPVCGGVSTVIVDAKRFGNAASEVTSYRRAAPPGPAVSLAFAPTVFADRLEFGLVYRMSCLSATAARELLAGIVARLERLAGPAPASVERTAPVRVQRGSVGREHTISSH
jgi:hypothetical protein